MPMQCVSVHSLSALRKILRKAGHDFWLGCLAGVIPINMPDKIESLRVDDILAHDVFTHCYSFSSTDIRAESNVLIDEFGLGLRKKRTTSNAVPGCVYLLVNEMGPTVLSERRAQLNCTDRRLSTEERLRMTSMQFTVVRERDFHSALEKNTRAFWLTSYAGVDAEACKKRVMSLKVDDTPAAEMFQKCWIAETQNMQATTEAFTARHGLGLRNIQVRSRSASGCVVVLLQTRGILSESDRKPAEPSNASKSEATGFRSAPVGTPVARQVRTADQPEAPSTGTTHGQRPSFKECDVVSEDTLLKAIPSNTQKFWLTAYAGIDTQTCRNKLVAKTISGEFAVRRFQRCWIAQTKNILITTERFTARHGLGLRAQQVPCKPESGCVALLVQTSQSAAPSIESTAAFPVTHGKPVATSGASSAKALSQAAAASWSAANAKPEAAKRKHADTSTERALDTGGGMPERTDTAPLQIAVGNLDRLAKEVDASKGEFWMTAFTGLDVETCRRRIPGVKVEGEYAFELFKRCLLTSADDCTHATNVVTTVFGLGLRKASVRSKPERGCIALFLEPRATAHRVFEAALAGGKKPKSE